MEYDNKTLELNIILEKISSYAVSETAIKRIISLKPIINYSEILSSLNKTHEALILYNQMGGLPLIPGFDIYHSLKKAKINQTFSFEDVSDLFLLLKLESDLIEYKNELKKNLIKINFLKSLFEEVFFHKQLRLDLSKLINDQLIIKDNATPQLSRIRKELKTLTSNLEETLNSLTKKYSSFLNEQLIVIRNSVHVLPVKEAFKNKVKGTIHGTSATSQTVYIEPTETRELVKKINNLKIEEANEITKILSLITSYTANNSETITTNLNIFVELDFIFAKARYGDFINANQPDLNETQTIDLINARHPLLEKTKVVPINIGLNEMYPTVLISGPNTGGKTVALKTVGLLVLMTQSGILIPASASSTIGIFDQVFADIGDDQSISQSLSTFSSHLTKIVNIVNKASKKSLVLLDELGSGTDPVEGVALAISIIEELHKRNLKMIVTTHYSELKLYANQVKGIRSASVAFDRQTLSPLYTLKMDSTGSSEALYIASKLGLKQEIIDNATKIVGGKKTDLSNVIAELEKTKEAYQSKQELLEFEFEKTAESRKLLLKSQEKLNSERTLVLERVKKIEEEKWLNLNRKAKDLIIELEDRKTLSLNEAAKYKHETRQRSFKEVKFSNVKIEINNLVFIEPYQQVGIVKDIKQGIYKVEFGMFILDFEIGDLSLREGEKEIKPLLKPTRATKNVPLLKEAVLTELDLRGFRYEEVSNAMDLAIDQVLLANLTILRVIHGFGAGVIRTAVYDYIKKSSQIASYRFGAEGEGLNGVTIITLK